VADVFELAAGVPAGLAEDGNEEQIPLCRIAIYDPATETYTRPRCAPAPTCGSQTGQDVRRRSSLG
jgi:hypothetical protein